MFLTTSNIPHYLMSRDLAARGQIDATAITGDDFMVVEGRRRNRNFRIERKGAPRLFIKQVPIFHQEATSSNQREAACWQLAFERDEFAPLRALLPKLVDYDRKRHVLIMEWVDGAENLTAIHNRLRSFPPELAALQAKALAACHGASMAAAADPSLSAIFPKMPPWVLNIAETAEQVMPNMSPGARQLVMELRANPRLIQGLGAAHAAWTPCCLIHGDIKWDNFLLPFDSHAPSDLKIIDWELADMGDPAWDLACVMAGYLLFWLLAIPANPSQGDPGLAIPHAPYQLRDLWPAMRAAFQAWHDAAPAALKPLCEPARLALFTGARVVLLAFEMVANLPSFGPHTTLALRLAEPLLNEPWKAMGDALGLGNAS